MKFSIHSIETGDALRAECELVIGDHRERFPLITNLWGREKYEAQWKEALEALVDARVDRCALITDIQDPEVSYGVTYWVLFREGQDIFLQERFSRDQVEFLSGSAASAAPHIAPRVQGTWEEHSRVSEWVISLAEVSRFLDRPAD